MGLIRQEQKQKRISENTDAELCTICYFFIQGTVLNSINYWGRITILKTHSRKARGTTPEKWPRLVLDFGKKTEKNPQNASVDPGAYTVSLSFEPLNVKIHTCNIDEDVIF